MPSFSMLDLPALLRNNKSNRLVSYKADGSQYIRSYSDVYADAYAVAVYLRDQGCPLGPENRAVVAGDTGYD